MSNGLRTATSSGVKLVSTNASPSGSRLTAQYRQLRTHNARSHKPNGASKAWSAMTCWA